MAPHIDLTWPTAADEPLRAGVHSMIHAVAETGGAIGHLTPPGRPETDAWLDGVLAAVRAGEAALALARADGEVAACGLWRRDTAAPMRINAQIQKVMAHPRHRGLGLGATVVSALVDRAREAGLEVLTLGVRGNNHGAIELYERLGFRVWGRRPNVIAVGDERFDSVEMCLELDRPPHVSLRGSRPGGIGSSPRRR